MSSQQIGYKLTTGTVAADILVCDEGLSFWGGVCPDTADIIDIHHPQYGANLAGKIVMMPTSRGSCSGSGVLLSLSLSGLAPAALIFSQSEEILGLGALVAEKLFDKPLPILHLSEAAYDALRDADKAIITNDKIISSHYEGSVSNHDISTLALDEGDKAILAGRDGDTKKTALEIICLMALSQGAGKLLSVTKGHIDGCILAHDANLIFAEKMQSLGAQVSIPTTINAISVDRENWPLQNIPADFGNKASRLADAYVKMGAKAVFTCAPYLLDDAPQFGEVIGWSESNAVIYANSVLGARTLKHADYLDLFIAMTGRAPATGVYHDEGRRPQVILSITPSTTNINDSFWPLLGWLAGTHAPHQIPLITGLKDVPASQDDLKGLCAGFGTTSAAPMLHIEGHTAEADLPPHDKAIVKKIDISDMQKAWQSLNQTPMTDINLIAIGSPHASLSEVQKIHDYMDGRIVNSSMTMIITVGRQTLSSLKSNGLYAKLISQNCQIISDICWCSITSPLFPITTKGVMTNSAKYAHYAHGLSSCYARLADLHACVEMAVSGKIKNDMPRWLSDG